jgi:hypothetical protein
LSGLIDYRAVVIDLSATPLSPTDRRHLARKIRDIHAVAQSWDPSSVITDAWLNGLVEAYEKRLGEHGGLRPLCKAVTKALELAEQHPHQFASVDASVLVSMAFQQETPA